MAELVEGTYAVISAASGLALDVKGESDKSGANVQIHTVNSKDSQVWALTTRSGTKWQFRCSLTGKYLYVKSGKVGAGKNVLQSAYTKKSSQTWDIVSAGTSYTYKGHSYPTYYIKNGANNSYVAAATGTTKGTNVQLASYSSGNSKQKWIFVPQPIFSDGGTYSIEQALSDGDYVTVRSGSTANNAGIGFTTFKDFNYQIFRVSYNESTGLCQFIAAHSNKVLSSKGGKGSDGTPIVQLTNSSAASQNWLVVQNGKSSRAYQGEVVPTYEIRAQVGTNKVIEPIDDTLKLGTRLDDPYQRFIFHKAEMEAGSLTAPTSLNKLLFVTEVESSEITPVENLTFRSGFKKFQARYSNIYYNKAGEVAYQTQWMNILDSSDDPDFDETDIDVSARNGWGDAWSPTFTVAKSGTIHLPFAQSFSSNIRDTYRMVKTLVDVRVFSPNVNGFVAHGPYRRNTIVSVFKPDVSIASMVPVLENGKLGLKITFSTLYEDYFQIIRCRVIDMDGKLIAEINQSSSMSVTHYLGESLKRFPENNERLTVEFDGILNDVNMVLVDTIVHTFSYGTSASELADVTVGYFSDDSCRAIASAPFVEGSEYTCYSEVVTEKGIKYIHMEDGFTDQNRKCFTFYPPLNRNSQVVFVRKNSNGTLNIGTTNCHMESHLFIWNWISETGLEEWASIIVNSDNPPSQNRTFSNDTSYTSVAGRTYPVAFASKNLEVDLSVEGVVIDEEELANVTADMPEHGKLEDIKNLVTLSGRGIHPIYRTPYGDVYQVAISAVNANRGEMRLTPVSVTQKAVED